MYRTGLFLHRSFSLASNFITFQSRKHTLVIKIKLFYEILITITHNVENSNQVRHNNKVNMSRREGISRISSPTTSIELQSWHALRLMFEGRSNTPCIRVLYRGCWSKSVHTQLGSNLTNVN